MTTGALILSGGKSRRMGRDKMLLDIGGQSFLSRIAQELACFSERLLSVGENAELAVPGFEAVYDLYADCGPIAGLYAGLTHCRSDALLVVPCDVPLFERALGEYLLECLGEGCEASVAVTRDGRAHPYCGVYRKSMASLLRQRIGAGQLSLMDALPQLPIVYAGLSNTPYPDACLTNVNTPEEYQRLLKQI